MTILNTFHGDKTKTPKVFHLVENLRTVNVLYSERFIIHNIFLPGPLPLSFDGKGHKLDRKTANYLGYTYTFRYMHLCRPISLVQVTEIKSHIYL